MRLNSKRDFQECLEKMALPLEQYYTSGVAAMKCGATGVKYGEDAAQFEAFTRPLWGLAPLWAGGGDIGAFQQIYLKGIINGTNPERVEYWGSFQDKDQKLVDVTPIALALILAPEKIWEPLSDGEKRNLSDWLYRVNDVECCNNNWYFFPVLVNLGLKNVGENYNPKTVEDSLAKIDSFYIGNGWYSDGNSKQMDYYIAFAIHFYSLIYARVMEQDDAERSRLFKERAMLFAKDFIYWFDEDGAALAFGRSLIYRFAQCCFWSACIFAGIEPFPMGVMKGIIVRNLEYWLEQPIFDNGGILNLGYAYSNMNMIEDYNAYGSPYWAWKTFLFLALEEEHEFFKTKALPLPELEELHVIKEANMVLQRVGGYVTAITAGQWAAWEPMHVAEKYSKFTYSSRYGFSVPRSYHGLKGAATDNMLTFVKEGFCFVRRKCERVRILEDGTVYSEWSPYNGVKVETSIMPTKTGHIRKHVIYSEEACEVYDCSFATKDDIGTVSGNGEILVIQVSPNTNLVHNQTQIKAVKYSIAKGRNEIETVVEYPT